ncbi:MAG: hypothetical protein Q7U75_05075, partial [Desulfobacterales bacterium]|nr:hypothetical protein [Desulfobacterales bacterium]
DAIALGTGEAERREFFETSSLVPALALVAALLRDETILQRLREEALPLMRDVTLERWFPTADLEILTGTGRSVSDVGVSRALAGLRNTALEEADAARKNLPGAAVPSDFKWHGTPWSVLVALSARLHRHPLPTWFLAEHALPANDAGPDSQLKTD